MEPDNRSCFARGDWLAASVAAGVALLLYLATLAPTVTLEQSGALVVAAMQGGAGRSPGYPCWHIFAKLFTTAFSFVQYRGHPNPAWALNFMSAVFGSLSCGLVALLISRIGRELVSPATASVRARCSAVAATLAGGLLALAPILWSQSVIVETHTLTLACILLFLTVGLAWCQHPSARGARLSALMLGVGLAQSPILALLTIPWLLALIAVNWRLCRDFLLAVVPVIFLGAYWLSHGPPALVSTGALVLGAFLILALAWRFLPQGQTAAGMVLMLVCGLGLYAYLPLGSFAGPALTFGDSRIWEHFLHLISRGQYERIVPTDLWHDPGRFQDQLRWLTLTLMDQFPFPLAALALWPAVRLSRFSATHQRFWLLFMSTLGMFTVVLLIGMNPKGDIQDALIQRTRLIPACAMLAVLIGWGLTLALGHLIATWHAVSRSSPLPQRAIR